MSSPPPGAPALSALLRDRTRAAHEAAEGSAYVRDLVAGALPLDRFADLVAQHHAIYGALEAGFDRYAADPVAGPFVSDGLRRVPHLRRDLAALLGRQWEQEATRRVRPATEAYARRIEEVVAGWPAGFVAHHYVRYLGDVSGGQFVRRAVARAYGGAGERATSFYDFSAVGAPPRFRQAYRERLDALDLPAGEVDALVAEARAAFGHNLAVFEQLAVPAFSTIPAIPI